MDKNQEHVFLAYSPATLPPAQLIIGQYDHALASIQQLLQKIFCNNNGCNTCNNCMRIREKQHHAIMWFYPEKNYTIDQLDDLFSTLSLQLQPNELFFFVIQKADFLTAACANKLLKPMEEPPAGYHFILLAEHPEQILPTIKSRCIIHTLETQANVSISHPLFEVFTQKIIPSHEFSKILDGTNINERESIELLDQILNYWMKAYQKNHDPKIISLIEKLHKAQLQPPMPGSNITFWRNVYLQTYNEIISLLH